MNELQIMKWVTHFVATKQGKDLRWRAMELAQWLITQTPGKQANLLPLIEQFRTEHPQ